MNRPAGVTASAIVAILGSIVVLLFAAAAIASLFIEAPRPQPPNRPEFVVVGALMFVAFATIGIWTSVGLLRLRSWARTSILIFAGFMVAMCAFSLLVTMAVPIPPELASTEKLFRRTMALAFGIPLVIGVWWLIQFNARSTKAAFASSMPQTAPTRPLGITIVALASILGGVSFLVGALTRTPLFLFGALLHGWAAGVIYAVFAALSLYIAKGLLALQEEARVLGIGWFAFSFVHMSVVTLVPPVRQRMLEFQRSIEPTQTAPLPFNPDTLLNAGFAAAAIVAAVAIWLLIRNRAAFGHMEKP